MSLQRLVAAGHRVRRGLGHLARAVTRTELPAKNPKQKPKTATPIPDDWEHNSWEDKARQNPLYAVMTTEQFVEAQPDGFSDDQLQLFFAKGRDIVDVHLKPLLTGGKNEFIVEYGCGMGRILKSILADGYDCAGIDISPTMLEHCRRLVPGVKSLYLLNDAGRCTLPDGSADLIFSYAVLQHIETLSIYLTAVDEICRVLKPGGSFAIQVNCEDFTDGLDTPGRTENFEDRSVHYHPGATDAYSVHPQTTWSGVYIGAARLRDELSRRGCTIEKVYYHNPNKLRAVWVTGRKARS